MRLAFAILAILFLVGVPTVAVAGEPATIPIDLSAAGGPTMWLRCSGDSVQNCGIASLWLQTNGVKGLQTSIFAHGGRPWEPDTKLTP
jgi:hypothetical protein